MAPVVRIAAGYNGEKEGDSSAWLTCFTLGAPASYLLVLNRRSWENPGTAHKLLIASASIFALVELILISHSVKILPSLRLPNFELPVWIGIPIYFGAMGSLAATPFLSLVVFLQGRRQPPLK